MSSFWMDFSLKCFAHNSCYAWHDMFCKLPLVSWSHCHLLLWYRLDYCRKVNHCPPGGVGGTEREIVTKMSQKRKRKTHIYIFSKIKTCENCSINMKDIEKYTEEKRSQTAPDHTLIVHMRELDSFLTPQRKHVNSYLYFPAKYRY